MVGPAAGPTGYHDAMTAEATNTAPGRGVRDPLVSTFSIVGYDPEVPAWGVAIASRFLAVGAQTCWASPDAGVVVVQAYLNAGNGPEGLQLLRQGLSSETTIERLMAEDFGRELRQLAVIDRQGVPATYTGEGCEAWAGGVLGRYCAAQGNMLLGGEGCQAMVDHFSSSTGTLTRRLVDALEVGDTVAGDARGRQSAALLVVRPPWDRPLDVFTEPSIDLRVDDHENPFRELSRLLDLHELIYLSTAPQERMAPDPETVTRYQRAMAALELYRGEPHGLMDDGTREALKRLAWRYNLRNRLSDEAWLDRRALDFLERLAGSDDAQRRD